MGKGEIARYKQFLLFPQCFQKACFLGASKGVFVWEWVKKELTLYQMTTVLDQSNLKDFADKITLSQTSPCFYMSAVQVCVENRQIILQNQNNFQY